MYNLSGAASDVFRRFVTPGFASAWSWVRDLTGRGRRVRGAANQTARAADKRRNLDRWNKAHDR